MVNLRLNTSSDNSFDKPEEQPRRWPICSTVSDLSLKVLRDPKMRSPWSRSGVEQARNLYMAGGVMTET